MQASNIRLWAEQDQPIYKVRNKGADHLSDVELLAILIQHGTATQNAVELARSLLATTDNSLKKFAAYSVRDIVNLKIKGIGKVKAVRILAAIELGSRRIDLMDKQATIHHSRDVASHLKNRLQFEQREVFMLLLLNQANKIIKAQALAERYVDKINTLIVQAKNSGLLDVASQLENTKIHLASSNSTSQITKNIKIIITINNNIKETQQKLRQANFDVDEIKLSQNQKFIGKLNQLETKAKFLHSESIGSNAALYYVEKALFIISDVRNNLDDSEGKIMSKIKLIEELLSKSEKIVQEST